MRLEIQHDGVVSASEHRLSLARWPRRTRESSPAHARIRAVPVAAIVLSLVTGRRFRFAGGGVSNAAPAIETVLQAPAFPRAFVSPSHDVVLLATPLRMLPIAELARPMLRLAGLRIDPNANGIHHAPSYSAFELVRIASARARRGRLPPGPVRARPFGAPTAVVRVRERRPSGTELWIGSAEPAVSNGSTACDSTRSSVTRSHGCPTGISSPTSSRPIAADRRPSRGYRSDRAFRRPPAFERRRSRSKTC